jgi:hypothetical protein
MTNVGDPGHIAAHNVLREHVLAEAARFGLTPPTLAGPFTGGEPDHIGAHNALLSAIEDVATAGGIDLVGNLSAVGLTLPDTAHLGDPGHVSDHDVLTAAVGLLRASDAYNAATGGTVTDKWDGSKMWRIHKFTANGNFTVTKDVGRDFRVMVVGGGDSGASWHHAWGWTPPAGANGAAILNDHRKIALGTYPVVVGAATPGPAPYAGCNPGSTSTFIGISARAGSGVTTDIDGTMKPWPGNGFGIAGTSYITSVDGDPNYGRAGGTGEPGIVFVSYEVAPWNVATGGTVKDVDNYNGTGQKWRTHTFTANGTLNVSIAAQPFSVVVGGGGGGSGQNSQGAAGGKGGDGQGIQKLSQTLATGSHAVVVGGGGAGGPADGWGQGNGSAGGASSLGTITATGGGGGYGPGDQNHPQNPADGSPNGPTITSTITGASATYGGAGGPRPMDHPARPGNAGNPGSVVVAYRIG